MPPIEIRPLTAAPEIREALSEILIEAVASGGSVSFMHPLARELAEAFGLQSLASAERDERIVLGAFDANRLIGTVTLLLDSICGCSRRIMSCAGQRGPCIA